MLVSLKCHGIQRLWTDLKDILHSIAHVTPKVFLTLQEFPMRVSLPSRHMSNNTVICASQPPECTRISMCKNCTGSDQSRTFKISLKTEVSREGASATHLVVFSQYEV